jgi:hypothetical protein
VKLHNQVAKLVNIGATGVDEHVGICRNRSQQFAFPDDGISQRDAAAGERVFAPRLAEAFQQGGLIGLQEQYLAVNTLVLQAGNNVREIGQLARVVAGINTDGDISAEPVCLLLYFGCKRIQQGDREKRYRSRKYFLLPLPPFPDSHR